MMFLYSAKSEDHMQNIADVINFNKSKGNRAFYGEGLYLSDRVEACYTKGAGCVYVFDSADLPKFSVVKEEDSYKWYLTNHLKFQVTDIKLVSVEEALSVGWEERFVEIFKSKREDFKFYYLKSV